MNLELEFEKVHKLPVIVRKVWKGLTIGIFEIDQSLKLISYTSKTAAQSGKNNRCVNPAPCIPTNTSVLYVISNCFVNGTLLPYTTLSTWYPLFLSNSFTISSSFKMLLYVVPLDRRVTLILSSVRVCNGIFKECSMCFENAWISPLLSQPYICNITTSNGDETADSNWNFLFWIVHLLR